MLYQLVKISQSKAVFEFGSCFGYSALWIAMALPEEGRIICTEFDKGKVERGRQYFDRAKLSHKVTFEVGDAFESFQRYPGPFDLIFCDLDKRYYPQVLEVAVPKLKSGGLLIADNVLWSGKVLDRHDHSKDTEGIRQFDKGIYCHPELFSSILPVRDGLSVSLKK
ncbi:MAG: O-methyltransferase [Deltaproteobacteria bacterium]|nr:O-methyltransferase [Deltaproteobacteria bacterium]